MPAVYGKNYAYFAASLLVSAGVLFGLSPKIHAAVTANLPNQSDFTGHAGGAGDGDMYLAVAAGGANYKLEASASTVKIYVPASRTSVGIRIENAAWCPNDFNNGPDSLLIRNYPNTVFIVDAAAQNEVTRTPITYFGTDDLFDGVNPCPANPGADGVDNANGQRDALLSIDMTGVPESTVAGHEGYKVLYFQARNNGFTDAINMFKLRVSAGSFISYYAGSGQQFALGQGWIQPPRWQDYEIEFAPSCNTNTGTTSTIRWFDADSNQPNQTRPNTATPTTITTRLEELDFNTGAPTGRSWSFNLTGGQGVAGSHSFTVVNGRKYRWTLQDVDSRNGIQFQLPYDSFNVNQDCTPTAATEITCGNVTPAFVEVNEPFTLTAAFRNSSAPGGETIAMATHRMTLTQAGTSYNNTDQSFTSAPPGSTGIATSSSPLSFTAAGTYATTMNIYDDKSTSSTADDTLLKRCDSTILAGRKPYLRVFNGDVAAGSLGCLDWPMTAGSLGGIIAFSKGSRNGAGTQLMAQALEVINGFSSAQAGSAKNPPDKYLTLANDAFNTYGGSFGAGTCPPNYFGAAPSGLNEPPALSTSTDGTYYTSNPLILPAATIGMGKKVRIYVDGDVAITSAGIRFENPGGWTSLDQIPSFVLIARNIYIASDVTQLDGIYIAQPRNDGSGGVVYTCSDGNYAPPSEVTMAGACAATPLKVYGSVIAKTIKLLRTNGSLINSTANEQPGAGINNAAERFIYSPEVWLRAPDLENLGNNGFDALISQPPVL